MRVLSSLVIVFFSSQLLASCNGASMPDLNIHKRTTLAGAGAAQVGAGVAGAALAGVAGTARVWGAARAELQARDRALQDAIRRIPQPHQPTYRTSEEATAAFKEGLERKTRAMDEQTKLENEQHETEYQALKKAEKLRLQQRDQFYAQAQANSDAFRQDMVAIRAARDLQFAQGQAAHPKKETWADRLATIEASIAEKLASSTENIAGVRIDLQLQASAQSRNQNRLRDIQALRVKYLRDDGLILPWADDVEATKNYRSQADESDLNGLHFNDDFNTLLRSHHLAQTAGDTDAVARYEHAIAAFVKADQLHAEERVHANNQPLSARYKELAERFESRGRRVNILYSANATEKAKHLQADVPDAIAQEFNLGTIHGTSVENFEIIQAARFMERQNLTQKVLGDEALRFHAAVAFYQAQQAAERGDTIENFAYIDRLYAMLDYLRGTAQGVYAFGEETVEGWAQLLAHPLDSITALADSVAHYDRTFEIIQAQIRALRRDYDSLGTRERGKLHARIAAEVISTFIPIGAVAKLGAATKVAGAVEKVIPEVLLMRTSQLLQEATTGRRYAGQLKSFIAQNEQQLIKSIQSFEKNIAKHKKYIADPSSHVPVWDSLSLEHQKSLIHHWENDIQRAQDYMDLATSVLKTKNGAA